MASAERRAFPIWSFPYMRWRLFLPTNPMPTIQKQSSRHISSLDGLRGLAFLSVFCFHYIVTSHLESRWSRYEPPARTVAAEPDKLLAV